MNKIRYAIVGTGGIANVHRDSFLAHPEVELVGLSDASPAALANFARHYPEAIADQDFRAMFAQAKPDIVSVCTPNSSHAEISLAALEAGAHVACEKPMAMTVEEAEHMEATRARLGLLGGINFSYRNVTAFRFARDIIAHGDLGTITRVNVVYLQSHLGAETSLYAWRHNKELAGFGALGDLGVHMIDAIRFVTGLEFQRVVGMVQTLIPQKKDAQGVAHPVTIDTNAAFLAELSGGAIATCETTQVAPGFGNHFRIEVSGRQGTLRICSEVDSEIELLAGPIATADATWKTQLPRLQIATGYAGRQKGKTPGVLVEALRGDAVEYPTFADGVRAQKMLAGIFASTQTHAWVDVT